MITFSNGSTPPPPPPPSKEEQEAVMAFRITEEEIQRQALEIDIWIAEYRRKYPDNWKPEHLR